MTSKTEMTAPSAPARRRGLFGSVFVQITAITALCVALVATAMAFNVYRVSIQMARDELRAHASEVTPLIAFQLGHAVAAGDTAEVQATIDTLTGGTFGPAIGAVVIDAQGEVIASDAEDGTRPGLAAAAEKALATAALAEAADEGAVATPIRAPGSGTVIGAVATAWDIAPALADVRNKVISSGGIALGVLVVALTLAALLFRQRISLPLARVDEAMSRIGAGDYDVDVPARNRRDEIGTMAGSLESFRASLAAAAEFNRIGLLKGSAFEGSSAALMITDDKLRVMFTNPAVKRLFDDHADEFRREADQRAGLRDFSSAAVVGRPIVDMLGQPDLLDAIVSGRAKLPVTLMPRFARTSFRVDVDAVLGASGDRIGYVVEWKNVSAEQRNSAALDAIDASFVRAEFGSDGTILTANARFAEAAREDQARLAGRSVRDNLLAAGKAGAEAQPLFAVLAGGATYSGRIRLVRPDRSEAVLDATVTPLRGSDGKADSFALLGTDVTEAQAQLLAAEAERTRMEAEQRHVVEALRAALGRLSEGDLTVSIEEAFGADHERLRSDFNEATARLRTAMAGVVETAAAIRSETTEISTAADDLSRRTEQQAATLEQTAAALDELTSSVKSAADGAAEANRMVSDAKSNAESSGQVVREAVRAMNEIEESSLRISKITGVIDEIAFQTNLLALNAGVEAARAGDAGRGFAVVASEVRALAQRSSEAAREIAALIAASSGQVKRGVELVGEAGKALEGIEKSVAEVHHSVSEIAVSAREQSAGLAEINTAVNQLDQVTQQNAAMFEETSAASQSLMREAAALTDSMGRFRTGAEQPAEAAPAPRAPQRAPARPAEAKPAAARRRPTGAPATAGNAALARTPQPDVWEEF